MLIQKFKGILFIHCRFSSLLFVILISCDQTKKEITYKPEAVQLNNQGIKLMFSMQKDSALVLFKKAIEIDETFDQPYSNLIQLYLEKREYDDALLANKKLINLKPDLAEAWTTLGMIYDLKTDSVQSKSSYIESIKLLDKRIQKATSTLEKNNHKLNRAINLILLGNDLEGKSELRKLKNEDGFEEQIYELLKMAKEDFIFQIIGE